jgi:hypothetical protein
MINNHRYKGSDRSSLSIDVGLFDEPYEPVRKELD